MLLTSAQDGNEQSASVAIDLSQFTLNHRIKPDAISLLLEMAGTCRDKRIIANNFNCSCVYY
jgi:3-oxoacyl-[acyl-carrier-protein] synthase III